MLHLSFQHLCVKFSDIAGVTMATDTMMKPVFEIHLSSRQELNPRLSPLKLVALGEEEMEDWVSGGVSGSIITAIMERVSNRRFIKHLVHFNMVCLLKGTL